jgi:hypothetical protein
MTRGLAARLARDARLYFMEFFDWHEVAIRDNRYTRIKVSQWTAHPDSIRKLLLLIPTRRPMSRLASAMHAI